MKIHFIGIGGIGVSSLAQYYLEKGHEVSGSDLSSSQITDLLREKGAKIVTGQQMAENVKEHTDLVVYSPAVRSENPEYKRAAELGIKLQSYPEALGELTKQHYTIAVSGSHGKSTTTSMIGLLLAKAGLDPTVIVGTKLKEFGDTNFRMGRSHILVIEACEYDDSFSNYDPKIIVVTNVDEEHLDYFKTFANVVNAFKKFIIKLPKDGFLVANKDDKELMRIAKGDFTTIPYFLKQKDSAKLKKILKIPGAHNVSNALAVLAVARILGVKDAVSLKSISQYRGSWRRFEITKTKPFIVISDYAHHPTEVRATLKSVREKYKSKTIRVVFQPHQHQRTHYLFADFIKLFREAPVDEVVITDIYDVAGREEKNISSTVSSGKLVEEVDRDNVRYFPIKEAEHYMKGKVKSGDVLVIMGAGDIYKLADKF